MEFFSTRILVYHMEPKNKNVMSLHLMKKWNRDSLAVLHLYFSLRIYSFLLLRIIFHILQKSQKPTHSSQVKHIKPLSSDRTFKKSWDVTHWLRLSQMSTLGPINCGLCECRLLLWPYLSFLPTHEPINSRQKREWSEAWKFSQELYKWSRGQDMF